MPKSQEETDAAVVAWASCDAEMRRKMVEVAQMSCWKTEEEAKRAAIIWAQGLYVLTLLP